MDSPSLTNEELGAGLVGLLLVGYTLGTALSFMTGLIASAVKGRAGPFLFYKFRKLLCLWLAALPVFGLLYAAFSVLGEDVHWGVVIGMLIGAVVLMWIGGKRAYLFFQGDPFYW